MLQRRENFRRGITPNIRMRKDAVAAKNNGGVEVGSNNGASEPFLRESPKEDEELMEKEQRRKEVRANFPPKLKVSAVHGIPTYPILYTVVQCTFPCTDSYVHSMDGPLWYKER